MSAALNAPKVSWDSVELAAGVFKFVCADVSELVTTSGEVRLGQLIELARAYRPASGDPRLWCRHRDRGGARRGCSWRARRGLGASLIELFTYRREGHSTSDNPDAYRASDEGQHWPLGDPLERLKLHLIAQGEWSEERHQQLTETLTAELKQDWQAALAKGSLAEGPHWPASSLFDDVFEQMPPHLQRQQQQFLEQS